MAFVARNISKRFGATQALARVDFDVQRGEVHALLGENGAGKSTLVKIMGGFLQRDEGHLTLGDEMLDDLTPSGAYARGIVVVHQELSLLPNLSVAENILINRPPVRDNAVSRALGHLDRREMMVRARAGLALLHAEIDPAMPAAELSQAERQLVEIVRALAHSARLILLDEPTSALPPDERRELFSRIRLIRAEGVGIVFITHLLDEALAISDRITVLRDGRNVGTRPAAGTSVADLVELMTGRPSGSVFPSRGGPAGAAPPKLAVTDLRSPPRLNGVSFQVRAGEIVGLAGLVGSGRTECLKAIFGALPRTGGTIQIDGEVRSFASPAAAIDAGIALIPEDRQDESIFPNHSLRDNICMAAAATTHGEDVRGFASFVLDRRKMTAVAERLKEGLQVKAGSIRSPIASLSGGNQQKAILARWVAAKPAIVLADEPTRGVSIGSKIEIYRLIRELARGGAAVVIVSSEFEELLGLADQIYVLRDGRTVDQLSPEGLEAEDLLQLVLAQPSPAAGADPTSPRAH
jgi:ribose transport system ATP-binding protein